LVEPEWLL